MINKKTQSKLGVGLLVGAAVGAVAGLFLAPKSGKKLRADVLKRAADIRRQIEDVDIEKTVASIFDDATEQSMRVYSQAKDMLSEKLSEVTETISNIDKDKYISAVNDVVKKVGKEKVVAESTLVKLRKYLENDFKKLHTTVKKAATLKKTKTIKKS